MPATLSKAELPRGPYCRPPSRWRGACHGFLECDVSGPHKAKRRPAALLQAVRWPSSSAAAAAVLSVDDASAFLLLDASPAPLAQLAPAPPAGVREDSEDSDAESADCKVLEDRGRHLRLEIIGLAATALPGVLAAHSGLLAAGPLVAPCCLPLPVMFSVADVHPDTWLANKRARAFHRAAVVCVYSQAFLALLRFGSGDLIGGLYDAVMAGMGIYATEPDGLRLLPSYVMMCGFNGVLGCLQVIQQMHGVPILALPPSVVLPPLVAVMGAYCGWQFAMELNAIGSGYTGSGRPEDSLLVRIMGADWWPNPSSAAPPHRAGAEEGGAVSAGPSRPFSAFGGDGHRLGQQ